MKIYVLIKDDTIFSVFDNKEQASRYFDILFKNSSCPVYLESYDADECNEIEGLTPYNISYTPRTQEIHVTNDVKYCRNTVYRDHRGLVMDVWAKTKNEAIELFNKHVGNLSDKEDGK